MSHYSRIRSKMKKRSALVKALQDLGFKEDQIEVHDEAVNLYGYQGDVRNDKANIVIRRKHVGGSSNDIGFVRLEDGTYEAIISDFDRTNGQSRKNKRTQKTQGYSGKWMELLNQRYSFRVIEEQANMDGFSLEEREENGEILVEATRDF